MQDVLEAFTIDLRGSVHCLLELRNNRQLGQRTMNDLGLHLHKALSFVKKDIHFFLLLSLSLLQMSSLTRRSDNSRKQMSDKPYYGLLTSDCHFGFREVFEPLVLFIAFGRWLSCAHGNDIGVGHVSYFTTISGSVVVVVINIYCVYHDLVLVAVLAFSGFGAWRRSLPGHTMLRGA